MFEFENSSIKLEHRSSKFIFQLKCGFFSNDNGLDDLLRVLMLCVLLLRQLRDQQHIQNYNDSPLARNSQKSSSLRPQLTAQGSLQCIIRGVVPPLINAYSFFKPHFLWGMPFHSAELIECLTSMQCNNHVAVSNKRKLCLHP